MIKVSRGTIRRLFIFSMWFFNVHLILLVFTSSFPKKQKFTLPPMPLTWLKRTFGHTEWYCGPKYMSKGFTTCTKCAVRESDKSADARCSATTTALSRTVCCCAQPQAISLGIFPNTKKDDCTEIRKESACGQ